ncbi:MAG: hypothetical protein ACK4NA_08225 [Alphaproteobacteria bacterium]
MGIFAALAVWSLAVLVAILPRDIDPPLQKLNVSDLAPRWQDYVRAFALCAVPVIGLVMIFTFMRIAVFGLQSSFYVVYLEMISIDRHADRAAGLLRQPDLRPGGAHQHSRAAGCAPRSTASPRSSCRWPWAR